jgi:hypothetical protein
MRFTVEQLATEHYLNAVSNALEDMLNTLKSILNKCGGYLDTSDDEYDCIYAVECEDAMDLVETQITALKIENDVVYYKTKWNGDEWRNLRYSDNFYLPTIVSIMDGIFAYVPFEDDRD